MKNKKININNFVLDVCNSDLEHLPLNDLFALKLRYLYLALGSSQLNFSISVNLNLSYFNDLIRGRKWISLVKIEAICKALKIPPVELFNFNPLYLIKKEKVFVIVPPYDRIKILYE